MITQIILRFEDLPEKDRLQICDNLLTELNTERFIKDNKWSYKLFYKNGGINKPMIEVKRGWHIMTDKVDSAIYYFDHSTNKVNTIRLQTFLNRVNNYSNGRLNNKTYFALKEPAIKFKRNIIKGWHINIINVIKSHNKRSENENKL